MSKISFVQNFRQ